LHPSACAAKGQADVTDRIGDERAREVSGLFLAMTKRTQERRMSLQFPKYMYRVDPYSGAFQSTLVATAEVEAQLVAEGGEQGAAWTDDPNGHGVEVVPYPCELTPAGTLVHYASRPDANGNHPYGPAPTAPGIGGSIIARKA
jgi:hypothetical protein